ncbi:hypothetical protein U9M48_028441 [Paspalum notatum var. saurae]|uniref:Retrotransposon gag domain-containing protein n=1 Tax=Paspalum notatum var. saurae TaxID=547442 RepID=A0AAQ3TVE5_PASNO
MCPRGLMKMKKKEFLSPKQGSMSVTEYRDKFLRLAGYATAEVAEDKEKQEYFLEGLNDELQYQLMNHTFPSFHQLVDRALFTERKRQEIEERKRKYNNSSSSSNTRPRFSQGPSSQQQRAQGQARLPVPSSATGSASSSYVSGSAPSADHPSHHKPDYEVLGLATSVVERATMLMLVPVRCKVTNEGSNRAKGENPPRPQARAPQSTGQDAVAGEGESCDN